MQRTSIRKRHGFTLIEMLTVVVVSAILVSVAFRLGVYVNQKLGKQRTQADLIQFKHAIDAYYKEYGTYPPVNHDSMNVNLFDRPNADTMQWDYEQTPPQGVPLLPSLLYYQDGLAKYLFGVPESTKWAKYLAGFMENNNDIYSCNVSAVYGMAGGWISWSNNGWRVKSDSWGGKFHYDSFPPYQSYRIWSAGPDGATSTPDDIDVEWDP